MAFIGTPLDTRNTFQSLAGKRFDGDGSTTAFTLDVAPSSTLDIEVFVGNVRQDPNSAYTLSGTTLTFTGAPPSGTNNIYVVHQAKSVGTIDVPSGGVQSGSLASAFLTGQTDVGGAIADADLFLIDDGAGGTFRKTAASRIKTYAGTTINNNADNRVITGSGTAGTLEGEAGLTFEASSTQGSLGLRDSSGTFLLQVEGNESAASVIFTRVDQPLTLGVNNSEKVRINTGGRVGIGTTSNTHGLHLVHNNSGNYVAHLDNSNDSTPYGLKVFFSGADPDDTTRQAFIFVGDQTQRCIIMSDGDLQNHDNSYGSISDQRIKQNITDANSQWDDIKNIKVRNFKKKDDVRKYGDNAWEQIGLVAQELETVSPKLLKEIDPCPADILSDSSFGTLYEDGDDIPEDKKIGDVKEVKAKVKAIKYSILYMKAIKALQEAMTKIETLEAKVKALEEA
jgi:hypothetical protein